MPVRAARNSQAWLADNLWMWRQLPASKRNLPARPRVRRQPEKTALNHVKQRHLLTFEQEWTDGASGRTLPKFVLEELHRYMACGILGRGFAHLYCDGCSEHRVVAFSCKARAVCRSCIGRRT
jgi:hypothetical protein